MKLNHCDSFVIYRKPYSKEIHIIVGNWTDENNSHNKTGFMFNEFPSSNPIFLVGKKYDALGGATRGVIRDF